MSNVLEGNETLHGFDLVPDGGVIAAQSAMSGWRYPDFAPPAPMDNTPPDDSTDTHSLPRRDSRGPLGRETHFPATPVAARTQYSTRRGCFNCE